MSDVPSSLDESSSSDNGLDPNISDIAPEASAHEISEETIENSVYKLIQIQNAVNHYVETVQISLNTIEADGLVARGKSKVDITQENDTSQDVESLLFYSLLPDQTTNEEEVFVMQSLQDTYGNKLLDKELSDMFPGKVSYQIKGSNIEVTLSSGEIETLPLNQMVTKISKKISLKNLAKTYIENKQKHEINMQTITRALASNSLKIDGNVVDSDINIKQMNKNVQKTKHMLDASDKIAHKLSSSEETPIDIKDKIDGKTESKTEASTDNATDMTDQTSESTTKVQKYNIFKLLKVALIVFIVIVLGGLLLYFTLRPGQIETAISEKENTNDV